MPSAEPLRPGPATPEAGSRIRERILDAATDCLLEEGIGVRLHAMIAERAGISRPTVYKYVGDQSAIHAAVLDRELDRFFDAVLPVLRRSDDLATHLIDAVTFVVDYARAHPLLQKALDEHPELILPALTVDSAPLVDRVVGLFEEQLERALGRTPGSGPPARVAAEWLYRLVVSLATTPSAGVDRAGVREYVAGLAQLMAVTEPPDTPA